MRGSVAIKDPAMFAKSTEAAIATAAHAAGIEPQALLAIAELESGGIAFASIDGRQEPLIRFEGHVFDRRLAPAKKARARAAGLASPVAGRIANPPGQTARWRLLDEAASIDRRAAYEAVSWGIGQVMGVHWKALGYADVEALVAEARSGVEGQVRLMVRFIGWAGLLTPLERRDWPRFARGYNGAGFARNGYDSRLAAAYRRRNASSRPAPESSQAGPAPERKFWRHAGDWEISRCGLHLEPPTISDSTEPLPPLRRWPLAAALA
jgi:hypothetical protein